MDYDSIALGARISARRTQLGIKQNELAEDLKISNNYLSGIERGKENITVKLMVSICLRLSITPDYLFLGCLHPNNVPQNLADKLRLCRPEDLELVSCMIDVLLKQHPPL